MRKMPRRALWKGGANGEPNPELGHSFIRLVVVARVLLPCSKF